MNPIAGAEPGSAARFVDTDKGLVSRRIFADDGIHRAELKRIFGRCWLYLAHESQLPHVGDYVAVNMGETPVIVCRGRDEKIAAFLNSCRHRGNRVVRADQGNTKSFVCAYHGWCYGTNGDLVSVPGAKDLYHDKLERTNWGLPKVAQVASYGGLIFGTFDSDAPPLDEYLGNMRWGLDILLGQGDMVALPGIQRWHMDANWKIAADNAIGDMYHASISHRSAIIAGHRGGVGNSTGHKAGQVTITDDNGFTFVGEYGHGLTADYVTAGSLDLSSPLAQWRRDPAIQKRMGPTRSRIQRANMNVFPNLFVNSGSRDLILRNPVGPHRIEIWKTTLVDRGLPADVQRLQARASNRHHGPGGMFEQDDGENWVQSTIGCRSDVAQRYDLNYEMGLGRGNVSPGPDGEPPRIDSLVNEHAQRWMYRCWVEYMEAPNWNDLKRKHSRPEGTL